MRVAAIMTTAMLVREYGDPCGKVCCSCGRAFVYLIVYDDGERLMVCSWCDLPDDDRWMR